jgi:hypothetical protein
VEPWIQAVKWTLLQESFFGGKKVSKNLREELLSEEDADDFDFEEIDDHDDSWILQGVPRRPLYKELAYQLCRWSKRGCTGDQLFLPAETLKFKDEAFLALIPPNKPQNFPEWLQEFGDMGILHVLGKRQTIGTDHLFLVPPSRKALLVSANLPHKPPNTLIVAARARSKHAHRGQEQFFGIATGSQETQNYETREILVKLLEEAVWINIHTFGGMEGNPVVELRLESGYGARWTVDWSSYSPENVEFRGFLEPQMEDGHEKAWRHGDEEYVAEHQKEAPKEESPAISVAQEISTETPRETTLEPPSTTVEEEQAPVSEKDTAEPSVEEEDELKLDSVPMETITSATDVAFQPAVEEVPEPTFEEQKPEAFAVEEQVAKKDEVKPDLSDKEKRKLAIEEELTKIVKETEQSELEEEIEPEALAALKKAAMIVAYRKKYYDVFKDAFVYFPTVTAALMNYALIEEAEKYYYDEDDEFPMEYSAALRSVAATSAADNDDDVDEDYMERLAMDVDIGEDADVDETNKDEEVQNMGDAEEEANQDDKAQKGTEEWVEVDGTGKKSEEKETAAEAPSPTVDAPEPEPTAPEEEAHIIDEAISEHFVVIEDEKNPKEDDGKLVEMPEPPVAEDVVEPVPEDAKSEQDAEEEPKKVEGKPLSEKEKRKVLIEEELHRIIKETEENELEEEIEPEALAALKKAAMIVAYRKKYYDVFKDDFIYFPTVTAALMNYALIEEAEKYYYDEDDEFPMYYSAALRSVAAMSAADNDDSVDEDYMERLAMDVDIGEDAGPEEQVLAPNEYQTTPTQEEWPEPSEPEPEPVTEEDLPEPVVVEEEPEPVVDEKEPEPIVEHEEPEPAVVEDDEPEPVLEESDQSYVLVDKEKEKIDEVVSDPSFEEEAPEQVVTEEEVPKTDDSKSLSEKAKRKVMIEKELAKIIKETEENELEEEIEPEALAALQKAALKVAYRKKYYDVFKDKFIYFPTVTAALMNYVLIEEAEKYYYEEDDEFPMDYSAGLRSVAAMNSVDDEYGGDEDYMERLAMDVDIGEEDTEE